MILGYLTRNMRKVLFIIIISISLNLLILSISHSQSSLNVSGVVPETDSNRNSTKGQIQVKQMQSQENKYLYYFEKMLGLQAAREQNPLQAGQEAQTGYDQFFSALLLWGLRIIFALLVWLLLIVFDKYLKFFWKIPKSRHKLA